MHVLSERFWRVRACSRIQTEKNTNTQAKEQYIWAKNLLHMLNVSKIILSRAAVKKSGVWFQFNAGLIVFLVAFFFSFS